MNKETRYRNICDILASISCPVHTINCIKEHFLKEIDSPRRFDRTNNIRNLLRILQKRDSLNIEHIDPLKYIALALQRKDVIALIDEYDAVLLSRCPYSEREETNNTRVIPPINPNPVERVYNLICVEIGYNWKDLARALEVPEGKIDELELTYRRISDMAREVLKFHRENADERYWKIYLCKGLAAARRNDLALRVSEIFAMHRLM